jgi:hypothetical protein
MAAAGLWSSLTEAAAGKFFFRKSSQRNLVCSVAELSGKRATADQTFLGSFLQKRTCFLA